MAHRPPKHPQRTVDDFFNDFDIDSACSVTDCTGLLPTPPQSWDEVDNYKELINYQAPLPEEDNKAESNPPFKD